MVVLAVHGISRLDCTIVQHFGADSRIASVFSTSNMAIHSSVPKVFNNNNLANLTCGVPRKKDSGSSSDGNWRLSGSKASLDARDPITFTDYKERLKAARSSSLIGDPR